MYQKILFLLTSPGNIYQIFHCFKIFQVRPIQWTSLVAYTINLNIWTTEEFEQYKSLRVEQVAVPFLTSKIKEAPKFSLCLWHCWTTGTCNYCRCVGDCVCIQVPMVMSSTPQDTKLLGAKTLSEKKYLFENIFPLKLQSQLTHVSCQENQSTAQTLFT